MNMEIMMKKILTAALLASVATSAFASDLPSRKAPPVMAPAYAPLAYSWTGFYVGVNGGYGIGDFSGFGSTEFGRPSGGLIGATAGYNYQIGQFVTGIEANLDWADITKSQTFGDGSTSKATLNSLGNVLARFGFAYDRALFYVAGRLCRRQSHRIVQRYGDRPQLFEFGVAERLTRWAAASNMPSPTIFRSRLNISIRSWENKTYSPAPPTP